MTLTLDATLDGDEGAVKATSITSASLLDSTGATVESGTVAAGAASFALKDVSAGDYFVEINGDADDLVPTRVDDPTADIEQRVGQQLRASYIGPAASPVYRINTYSAGQGLPAVAQYSDGAPISGEQPYVIVTLANPKIEFLVLGTAQALTSVSPTATHMSGGQPFDSWLLNTSGMEHHGDAAMGAGGSGGMMGAGGMGAGGMGMTGLAMCKTCHTNLDTKPAAHSDVKPNSGWCFQCHDGPTEPDSGFVDPNR